MQTCTSSIEVSKVMAIDTTGFKVTKLPPAIPEGADYIDLTKWNRGSGGVDGSMRPVKHARPIQKHEPDFGIGSSKHCELLDLGGSLAEDDLGLTAVVSYLTEPLEVLKADDPPARRGGSRFGGASTGGFHQRNRGIRGEVNNEPKR